MVSEGFGCSHKQMRQREIFLPIDESVIDFKILIQITAFAKLIQAV